MQQRDLTLLMVIIILAGLAAWIVWPGNPGLSIHFGPINIDRDIKVHSGLDLQGGMQVVLAADPAPGQTIDSDALAAAKVIVESRVNGLGVTEPLVQLAPPDRIVVELPGIQDPDLAVSTLRQTGLLEFVDAGNTFLPPGTAILSSYRESGEFGIPTPAPVVTATPTIVATSTPVPTATAVATDGVASTVTVEPTPSPTPNIRIFRTVITGQHLKTAQVGQDEYGRPEIQFELTDDGGQIFASHTSSNVGSYLAIAMDGVIISCPRIETAITEASGRITGDFELAAARSIVVQLRYGALPVPLKVIQNRTVGPTLGQDSVAKSTRAGIIGVIVVLVFMLVYYRLHGVVADALASRTAKLPRVAIAPPPRVIGKGTVDSIQSGLFYGYLGLVEGVTRRILDEIGDAVVIATGGFAEEIAPHTDIFRHVEPDLTLHGLRLLWGRNHPREP
jgi:preprotein translocase subunit SecD